MPDAIAFAPPDWFIRWVADYSRAFGVSAELTDTMLRLWWSAFAAAGYIERDFASVLPRLMTASNVPNWPREHLAAVNRELAGARDQRTRRTEAPAAPEGARCGYCGWTGWVEVPHPDDVRDGTWRPPYHRGCVACTKCKPGERKYHAACEQAREPPMTIDQYEQRVDPAWAEHLAERAEAERLMHGAEQATASLKNLTTLIGSVAGGMTPPRERRNHRRAAS